MFEKLIQTYALKENSTVRELSLHWAEMNKLNPILSWMVKMNEMAQNIPFCTER